MRFVASCLPGFQSSLRLNKNFKTLDLFRPDPSVLSPAHMLRCAMDLTVSISRHIRNAKRIDSGSRVSDFQFRMLRDVPILVDLRNGHARILAFESGKAVQDGTRGRRPLQRVNVGSHHLARSRKGKSADIILFQPNVRVEADAIFGFDSIQGNSAQE